ncbi:uncharacterized protein Z518_01416 [Rhinocladiella mackenziei CBS 650.93]|uniref:Cytochrome b mRNA-processing protein 4 n=1 Tax=Rhinocladiella mackenziei CBS 650.93 TaxID=1442369 RepID=A0A0D2IWD4_9EURO|nr:uncharacterized protein Z518_01416 [Rhinocladiella mackenziei CBS 650.93]KIX10334.1 hypothetical protein Z518_01416 [Rhinocladiella mackenziei CBS 650.93]
MGSKGFMYAKMVAALVPDPEEIKKKWSPELRQHLEETREEREKNMELFFADLKELSKSNLNIWMAMRERDIRRKQEAKQKQLEERALERRMREEMRAEALGAQDK